MTELNGEELQQLQRPSVPERTGCDIALEAISSIAGEIASLSFRNYAETAIDSSLGYNPDWGQYLSYELTDSVVTVTARYNTVLVGYAIFLIGPFKHNKEITYADLDTIWISPAFRSGFLAYKMIKMGERALEGRAAFIMATSTNHKPIDVLLSRLGYKPVEVLFWKLIGDNHGIEQSSVGAEKSGEHSATTTELGCSEPEHSNSSGEPVPPASV
jgi:hypothetical protein